MNRRNFILSLLQGPIYLPLVNPPVKQWEYAIYLVDTTSRGGLIEVLGKRGIEGWELCARVDRENIAELTFKRPKG